MGFFFQGPPANAVAGNMQGSHIVPNRNVPRQMPMVGMQRVQPQGMPPYNISSQAGMGGGLNPGGIPMQRGVSAQAHPQQQVQLYGEYYCFGAFITIMLLYYFALLMLLAQKGKSCIPLHINDIILFWKQSSPGLFNQLG